MIKHRGASGTTPPGETSVPMRLQRFLGRAGVASRRGSEDLITSGRVTVNGKVITVLGAKVDPSTDQIAVDGRVVTLADECAYIMLNKPAGYLTTMRDPRGRPTVADLVSREPAGLFPVGRLDRDTTGLVLFTTDGDLAHRLLHPSYHVKKTYIATVTGLPDAQSVDKLRRGIELDDGITAPAEVRLIETKCAGSSEGRVEIVIHEGRKRQVRRMLEAVGHPVISLHRSSFGPLLLGDLELGAYRALSSEEVSALRRITGR